MRKPYLRRKPIKRKPLVAPSPTLGIGGDDYWLGVGSAQRDHPEPGSWASAEFSRGYHDWITFRSPVLEVLA